MSRKDGTWGAFIKQLFYYHTTKVVQIRNWKLGLLYYTVMMIILLYVAIYAIYLKKGYQATGDVIGNTSLKVKQNAYLETDGKIQIWDAVNVVYPPKEADALFVTTNFLPSYKQSRGICPGTAPDELCSDTSSCVNMTVTTNGINTGHCNTTIGICDIYAWCPAEQYSANEPPSNFLTGVDQFTVFVRSSIKFPKWGVMRNNANGTELTPGYNLFTLGEMIENAGTTYEKIMQNGTTIAVVITWNCDLDKSHDLCQPSFDFIKLDSDDPNSVSVGFNFRYANYYYLPDGDEYTQYRDLYKVYGVRFLFLLNGQGGKFDIVPLLVNIGSGLALLAIATLISDIITLHVLPERKFYNKVKYEAVETPSQRRIELLSEEDASIQERRPLLEKVKV